VFTNILVALDGSDVSQRALIETIDLAKLMNARMQVICVIETVTSALNSRDRPIGMDTFELYTLLEKEGKDVLDEAEKYCADTGIAVTAHLRQGDAGTEIISLSEQDNCDLIVVGSRGKSGINRLFLGSVSSYVVKNNRVTTMVVR
jgi:nucleotide-binding universal stress UspA family protein